LQTARESDTLLGDLLLQLQELETEQHALERALDAARAEIDRELSACEAEIVGLERTVASAQPEVLTEAQTEIGTLQALESQRDRLQDDLHALDRDQAGLKATNAALKTEMNDLKDRLDRLKDASGATCPLCGQPLDEAHRTELIEQLEAEGKQRGDTYRSNQARMAELKAQVAEHKTGMDIMSGELKRLTPLIERAGVLQAGVDAASHAQVNLNAAQARAAALRQQLDQGDYAPDLRAQIEDNHTRRTALGYDKGQHTSVRRDLQTYRTFEAERTALEIALKALPDLEAALAGTQAGCVRLEQVIADENTQLETAAIEIARLEVLAQEQRAREAEVRKQHALERSAFQRVNNAEQELHALDKQRTRRVEVEARQHQRREDRALYETLREAFSKKGIPAMIIETAIPELESAANRLLMRMTDGRMQIKLETQREKITGGVAETLDIHIADELGTRSYELYSGGEAFRINFALRVALSQLLARRAGAHLRTLFIDEGFGTQDEDGRNKLVEAITAIQDDFDMILVVTHIDDLRDSFPVHLQVQKTREGSYVSLR
jgi:exonuclease SbcC